jgi:hypothetical protein
MPLTCDVKRSDKRDASIFFTSVTAFKKFQSPVDGRKLLKNTESIAL